MQSAYWRNSAQAYRVAKQRSNKAEEPVLLDIHATAVAPVPKLLILPWSGAVRVASITKPAHALERCESPGCHACKNTPPFDLLPKKRS